MTTNIYTLTPTTLKRLNTKFGLLTCYRCGKPLKKGDKIVAKYRKRSKTSTKRYHNKCYEDMFYESTQKWVDQNPYYGRNEK